MAKILVVDDEKIISFSLQRVLTRVGHEVTVANNGVEAIGVLQSKKFDLIFLDLLMPEIGGAEVLEFAKKIHPDVKIFMMTAYGDQEARDDLLSRGAEKVLSKPFDDITSIPEMVKDFLPI